MFRKTTQLLIIVALFSLSFMLLEGCGGKQDVRGEQKPPPQATGAGGTEAAGDRQKLILATNPPGSSYYSIAVAQANMISKKTDLDIIVQPTAGPTAIPKVVAGGEAQLGTGAGPTLFWAYEGSHSFDKPYPLIRLLLSGHDTPHIFITSKKSGIKSLADLKGKRVTIDYPTFPTTDILAKGILEADGLSAKEVVALKAESTTAAIEDLVNGRADAVLTSIGGAKLLEAAIKIDLALIPFDPQKVVDYFGPKLPAIYASQGPQGYAVGEGQAAVGFSALLWTSDKLPDEVAYTVVKTLLESQEELSAMGPAEIKDWTRKVAVRKLGMPYHPGAIKYFKEIGIWDESMDAYQAAVLPAGVK